MIRNEIEQWYLDALGKCESQDDPRAWGDDGYAVGRYQQHPSYYATWGPTVEEFDRQERSWDWAFRVAAARFFRAAWGDERLASMDVRDRAARIAMSYHLHGSLVFSGWDSDYGTRWANCWMQTAPKSAAE